jgi:flagellar biosynthesis protein FlhB
MADGGNKTEKATPKKVKEAREKGQVAKSPDVNGAVMLCAAVIALSAFGPGLFVRMEEATVGILALVRTPEMVTKDHVMELFMGPGGHAFMGAVPIIFFCAVAGAAAAVGQVGLKPSTKALKPDFKKLNPLTGAKNMFSPNSAVEAVKSSLKIVAVGGIIAMVIFPKLDEMAALVGMRAGAFLPHLSHLILQIAQRAALAYIAIAAFDFFWQRYRMAKNLKMDKEEVKKEHKQQELPPEIRNAQRRRGFELSRARMMDDVPTADVVVTNPTHYAVALRYDNKNLAPVVVAKGTGQLALRIRRVAADSGVTIVPDPPLARALHGTVDVGRLIPEELFEGVAQLLAYVYQVAGATKRAAA